MPCGWTSAPPMTTNFTAAVAGLRTLARGLPFRSAKKRRPPAFWTSISTSSWMLSSTSRMADSSRHSTRHKVSLSQLLPTDPHAAVIVGQTGCGKTVFCLDLLEGPYRGVFRHIVILCPTVLHNKTYKDRPWIWGDPEVYVMDPGERLHDCLRALYQVFQGEPCLFLIDDCAVTKALTKKKDMLSVLAFSGRHAGASVWVLTHRNLMQSGRTSESKRNGLLSSLQGQGLVRGLPAWKWCDPHKRGESSG